MDELDTLIHLNDRWLSRRDAAMDIEDRGVLFADGAYEVLRIYAGNAYLLDRHLARLKRSLEGLRFPPLGLDHLQDVTLELARRNHWPDARIYWQVTRGAAMRHRRMPDTATPSCMVMGWPDQPLDRPLMPKRLRVILQPDCRWSRCWIKSLMLLDNVLAYDEARTRGADDAIYERDGRLTEATAANLFIVRHGRITTPPADSFILRGITRDRIIELAQEANLTVREQTIQPTDLFQADEVFLTGTTTHVAAVTHVEDRPIAAGEVGPITQRLSESLESDIAAQCNVMDTPATRSAGT
ncbi:MAG: aminotransferase class IV [Phycisphaeraceae bacterium]|nr:aminotransferase class IV [Phycisphaeraceae bacterium]